MIDVKYQKLIQITVTHKCPFDCCHCSQLVPHMAKPFTMSLEQVETALKTLIDYPGHIGIFGGEPLLHPKFPEICKLMQKYVPVKLRRELWTMGANWKKYKDIIEETFYKEAIAYNEHEKEQSCWHQPLQIAIEEVVKDKDLMWRIINNCWVQLRWSAAITPKGAYFCEVAAARAHLFGKPNGIPVEKGWWKRDLSVYREQIESLCPKCSACLPMPMKANDKQEWDDVSPGMLQKLYDLDSPKAARGKCKTYDVEKLKEFYKGHKFEPETEYNKRGYFKDFPDWKPNLYRLEKKHEPKK